MANCHKCGKGFIRKRKDGTKRCVSCGYLPGFSPEDVAAKTPPNPFGTCFDSAAMILLTNLADGLKDMVMVHGVGIANLPGIEGKKIAHAWIEFTHPKHGKCALDPIWLIAQPVEIYYNNLQVSFTVEYAAEEFMREWRENDYPGPYCPTIKDYVGEGCVQ